jgi:hypothetical protein
MSAKCCFFTYERVLDIGLAFKMYMPAKRCLLFIKAGNVWLHKLSYSDLEVASHHNLEVAKMLVLFTPDQYPAVPPAARRVVSHPRPNSPSLPSLNLNAARGIGTGGLQLDGGSSEGVHFSLIHSP